MLQVTIFSMPQNGAYLRLHTLLAFFADYLTLVPPGMSNDNGSWTVKRPVVVILWGKFVQEMVMSQPTPLLAAPSSLRRGPISRLHLMDFWHLTSVFPAALLPRQAFPTNRLCYSSPMEHARTRICSQQIWPGSATAATCWVGRVLVAAIDIIIHNIAPS